jgi:hypothetical protein
VAVETLMSLFRLFLTSALDATFQTVTVVWLARAQTQINENQWRAAASTLHCVRTLLDALKECRIMTPDERTALLNKAAELFEMIAPERT